MTIIHCLRKNGHVLIPNWEQGDENEQIKLEYNMLVAIGWLPSELTEKETDSLRTAVNVDLN